MKRVLSLFGKKADSKNADTKDGATSHPQLHAFFVRPESSKTASRDAGGDEVFLLEEAEIRSSLLSIDESVGITKCRLNQHVILSLITSTYYNGLPLYASNVDVHQHTQHALQYIINQLIFGAAPQAAKRSMLLRLADAFRACQAEQGRVIDAIYGEVSGRDKGIHEQIIERVVRAYKETILEATVGELNPEAWKSGDGSPAAQIPHLISAYRVAIGDRVGLAGVEAAKLDKCRSQIDAATAARIEDTYKRLFDVDEIVSMICTDINQQDDDAERLIDRLVLTRWAGEAQQTPGGFNGYSLFYDDEHPELYNGKPEDKNIYQPFVHSGIVVSLLSHLYL